MNLLIILTYNKEKKDKQTNKQTNKQTTKPNQTKPN